MDRLAVASPSPAAPASTVAAGRPAAEDGGFTLFGEDGLTFHDILDVLNPLQHLPGISVLYRELTGDILSPLPRLAGGALFGGAVGAATSLLNVVVEAASGRDIGGHLIALAGEIGDHLSDAIGGSAEPAPAAVAVAVAPAGAAASPPGYIAPATGVDALAVLDRARRNRAYASVQTAARTAADTLAAPRRAGETDTAIPGLARLTVDA